MKSLRLAVVPLRILLALTFAVLLVGQVMSFPGTFAHWADQSPDFAEVRWPLLLAVELGLLCVQVVLVSTWQLLTLVKEDRVFTPASFVWVDAITWAVGVVWLLLFAAFVLVLVAAEDPGNAIAALMVMLPASVFALLIVVMRVLLLQATVLRTDMEAVI